MIAAARLVAVLLPVAVVSSTGLPGRASVRPTSGTTYEMRYVSTPSGDGAMAAAMEAQRANWSGPVVFAAGRGRIDIATGGQGPIFQAGDWMLFDNEDFIIVHPTAKTFSRLPSRFDPGSAMAAAGLNMSVTNVAVSLDSLGSSDTLQGRVTHRYRVTAAYTLTLDMAGLDPSLATAAPPIETKQTTDYWYADGADLPPPPFVGGRPGTQRLAGGMMRELSDKLFAAMRGLPTSKFVLKVKTSTRISGGAMFSGGTDNTMEITNLKMAADVDLDRLVLPADFSEAPIAGLEALVGAPAPKDSATKWRTRPRG